MLHPQIFYWIDFVTMLVTVPLALFAGFSIIPLLLFAGYGVHRMFMRLMDL